MKYFLLYGLAKGASERWQEDLLATGMTTKAQIEKVKAAAGADGFHSFRVASYTEGEKPDFANVFGKGKC